jgi:ferredoxin/coenzyme F420-reducing hydrogenase delta subunit
MQKIAQSGFGLLQRLLTGSFGPAQNPLNHLGALTIFFCWIVLISGIWLLIFFRTSVVGAFESIEYLTYEQWYMGGIMRSLHRYASDGAIVTIALHIIREFSFDAHRAARWFTWITGLPLVWMVFILGITGYWLVWDELAQYVAITSAELLDRIPIFTDSMAANFLTDSALSDRFFTLMAFLHLIGLPIFLVFGIWLHVFRLTQPRINPPQQLMAGTLFMMLALSLIFPAESHDKANLALVPQTLQLDWFYLHAYPIVQIWSPGIVWLLLLMISALIFVAPWLPPARRASPATVSLDNCNGCARCADDCPFGAIRMLPRSDGMNYEIEAVVDPELCVRCGICVGACPTATPFRTRSELVPGIDLPEFPAAKLRQQIRDAASQFGDAVRVLNFSCRGSASARRLRRAGEVLIEVECMAQIPPPFIDYVLSRNHADGVFLAGCGDCDCRYRFGATWTEQRIRRLRDPHLRKRIDDGQIALAWSDFAQDGGSVVAQVNAFRGTLHGQEPEAELPGVTV